MVGTPVVGGAVVGGVVDVLVDVLVDVVVHVGEGSTLSSAKLELLAEPSASVTTATASLRTSGGGEQTESSSVRRHISDGGPSKVT